MATERLPMRRIREILRLRRQQGLSVRETARALGVSSGVVCGVRRRSLRRGDITLGITKDAQPDLAAHRRHRTGARALQWSSPPLGVSRGVDEPALSDRYELSRLPTPLSPNRRIARPARARQYPAPHRR